jgi:hypothetical protein
LDQLIKVISVTIARILWFLFLFLF